MSQRNTNEHRRRFLRSAVAGAVAGPIAGLVGTRAVLAADKPKLDPESPQAQALNYVHDASKASDHSAYRENAICGNCMHWTGGDSQWGGCNIFPQNSVNKDGWCAAWVSA